MEYAPVCGEIGLNMGNTIYKTFGNACSACAAMKVVAYTPGECPAEKSSEMCGDNEGNYLTLTDAIAIAKESECGDNLVLNCTCPEGFVKDGDACNPQCYYSRPACMMPSQECQKTTVCNEGTGTYWIDLSTKKEGCSPACVVDVKARTAEINWRCTGLVQ
jgi:hypothetical protein